MADGSQASSITLAARNAAADAAAEARADAAKAAPPAKVKPLSKRAQRLAQEYQQFTVDVWLTNFNAVEFGVFKHQRNKAKSRQFTSDMDIFAEVTEHGERTGLIGYRQELWRDAKGMNRRLVFKLFNETLNWRATMDLMIGRSLQLTYGARGVPCFAFSANLNDQAFVVYVERSANKWPLLPENFSFFLLSDGRPTFYRLRRDLIDLGGDFTLYNERDEKIGRIDGSVFTLGGYWRGRVKTAHADPRLMVVLQMFCGMLAFNRGLKQHIRQLARDIRRGKIEPKIERQEVDLYMNPRRVR